MGRFLICGIAALAANCLVAVGSAQVAAIEQAAPKPKTCLEKRLLIADAIASGGPRTGAAAEVLTNPVDEECKAEQDQKAHPQKNSVHLLECDRDGCMIQSNQ